MGVIEFDSLTRCYGRRCAVDGLRLSVPEGALYGFLGPNGAGKTTTIRVLMGLLRPTSGSARVFGRDCWGDGPRVRMDIGYVPGDLRLYPWMSGRDALAIFGACRGMDLRANGRALAERFELDLGVRVRTMSRGMRQKLGLIVALAHRPRLLVLDEPSSALDPIMQQRLHAILRELAGAGHSVFFSSHTLAEVETLCSRVAIIRAGKLVADETLDSLRRRAGRDVSIRWKNNSLDMEPPAVLRLARRGALEWSGRLEGPVEELLAWLAGLAVEDVTIAPPDLESLFHRYYDGGAS